MNSILAIVLTFTIALAFLRSMDFFAHRGWIESHFSRKLIHIGTGPQSLCYAGCSSPMRLSRVGWPLFYGIMFVVLTVIFWKDSPVGMTALMITCGGDGVADLVPMLVIRSGQHSAKPCIFRILFGNIADSIKNRGFLTSTTGY